MNNGSTLLGWDDSPMNVMETSLKKDNKLSDMVILTVIKKLAPNDTLLQFF